MRWLFVGEADYASSGFLYGEALVSQGHQVQGYVSKRSPFNYPHAFPEAKNWDEVRRRIDEVDAVWVIQSDLPRQWGGRYPPSFEGDPGQREHVLSRLRDKLCVVQHGGSYYRRYRSRLAAMWDGVADLSVCHSADLMGELSPEALVVPPAPPSLEFHPKENDRLLIGHFPARAKDKGTMSIVAAVSDVEYSTKTVTWPNQIARMERFDVIIDQIKPELDGKPFGEWCSLAVEAAALGCIVIANSLNTEPYVRTYGRMPGIRICNTIEDLVETLEYLRSLSREEVHALQVTTCRWVDDCHSVERTGEILESLIRQCQAEAA